MKGFVVEWGEESKEGLREKWEGVWGGEAFGDGGVFHV